MKDGALWRNKSQTNKYKTKEIKIYSKKIRLRTTLRITNKNFQGEELTNELFLATRPKTKIRNAFTNNKT